MFLQIHSTKQSSFERLCYHAADPIRGLVSGYCPFKCSSL